MIGRTEFNEMGVVLWNWDIYSNIILVFFNYI